MILTVYDITSFWTWFWAQFKTITLNMIHLFNSFQIGGIGLLSLFMSIGLITVMLNSIFVLASDINTKEKNKKIKKSEKGGKK